MTSGFELLLGQFVLIPDNSCMEISFRGHLFGLSFISVLQFR